MDLWQGCYELTKQLPKQERFGLISQINRAAASIPANIVEGSSRGSQKEYRYFIQIALGSSFELETFFIGILRMEMLRKHQVDPVLNLVIEEQKMLSGFLKKLKV